MATLELSNEELYDLHVALCGALKFYNDTLVCECDRKELVI